MARDRYRIANQNECYFLTFTVVEWVDLFVRKEFKMVVADSLNYCIKNKGVEIFAWVLMSNHMHLIARAKEGFKLSDFIRDFKKFTNKRIMSLMDEINESREHWLHDKFAFIARKTQRAENYKVWQDGSHPIELNTLEKFKTRINYLHDNPVRQMIVSDAENYLFSSARDYSGMKGYVDVTIAKY